MLWVRSDEARVNFPSFHPSFYPVVLSPDRQQLNAPQCCRQLLLSVKCSAAMTDFMAPFGKKKHNSCPKYRYNYWTSVAIAILFCFLGRSSPWFRFPRRVSLPTTIFPGTGRTRSISPGRRCFNELNILTNPRLSNTLLHFFRPKPPGRLFSHV